MKYLTMLFLINIFYTLTSCSINQVEEDSVACSANKTPSLVVDSVSVSYPYQITNQDTLSVHVSYYLPPQDTSKDVSNVNLSIWVDSSYVASVETIKDSTFRYYGIMTAGNQSITLKTNFPDIDLDTIPRPFKLMVDLHTANLINENYDSLTMSTFAIYKSIEFE